MKQGELKVGNYYLYSGFSGNWEKVKVEGFILTEQGVSIKYLPSQNGECRNIGAGNYSSSEFWKDVPKYVYQFTEEQLKEMKENINNPSKLEKLLGKAKAVEIQEES